MSRMCKMSLVPYIGPLIASGLPAVIRRGLSSAADLGAIAGGVVRGIKRTADYYNSNKRRKIMPVRSRRGGTWGTVKRFKKFKNKKRSSYRKKYYKRRRSSSNTTTSRYKPYAKRFIRNVQPRVNNIASVIERAQCLSNPTSKILIQQNTEITSAANGCGWDEFFGCTSYGCTGFLGQCLPRQYGAHMSDLAKDNVNAATQPMFVKSVHFNMSVRDNISGTSHLKLYICRCIKNHKAVDYGGSWPSMVTKGLSSNYHQTFSTGSTALAETMVSFSPFSLPGFGRFWKVVSEEDFYIESSQAVDINKSFKINRFFQGKDLGEFDFFKGSSVMLLFKIVGDTDTATPWNLTAGGVSICVNKTVFTKWDHSGNGDRVMDGYGGTVPS